MSTKTILVTGCSSGIGRDAAQTLAARGWRVIATARKANDLDALRRELEVEVLHLELRDPQSVVACANAAIELSGGRLDAIFNNAAYGQAGAIEDLPSDALRQQFEANVVGTHELTRRIVPLMRKRGFGRIVQCSSILGFVAVPWRGAYCASKFALEALSTAMRYELQGTGVHVSLIEPGPIASRFVENAMRTLIDSIDIENSPHRDRYRARLAAMKQGGSSAFKLEPKAVTKRLIHAVESHHPRRRYYVTTPTYLAAGLQRVLPAFALDMIAKRI